MATRQAIEIPEQVISYLRLHHILTLGTSSFTGMPHAATTAYANGTSAVYFSMHPDQLTIRNIEANHFASFTIDDYTPEFRKVRELRGVGRCAPVSDPEEHAQVVNLFSEKLPSLPAEALANLQRITPLELHFVDFEYTAGVAVPQESSLVYEAAPEASAAAPAAISTQLESLMLDPGQVIVRQGERSDRFFIIVEGEVEVRREGHGQDVIVTRHGAGQLFGEIGALTGAPQEATFVAIQPSTVLAIDRRSFQDFAMQSAGADLRQRVRDTLIDLRRDTPPTSPPSGWYPDPSNPDGQRYWDGARWTEHVR
jgi:nitroimidazol reductase NimA-like FMN-containing flavoprotein (pyridoxamine 5'-phosphate oxidase superfamily)